MPFCWSARAADDHARAVTALREAAPPHFAFDTPIPYVHLQQMFDESAPWGIHAYEKAVYLDELTDAAIEVIANICLTRHRRCLSCRCSYWAATTPGTPTTRLPLEGGARRATC